MSTKKPNQDTKKSNARIAVGDLKSKADVRGGATTTTTSTKTGTSIQTKSVR